MTIAGGQEPLKEAAEWAIISLVGRFTLYLKEVRREFQRINWPTRGQALRLSLVVIAISLVVAAFLGFLDFVFSTLLQRIV